MLKVRAIGDSQYTVFSRDFAEDGEEKLEEVGSISQNGEAWTASCRGFDLGGFDSLNEAVAGINEDVDFGEVCNWRMV